MTAAVACRRQAVPAAEAEELDVRAQVARLRGEAQFLRAHAPAES